MNKIKSITEAFSTHPISLKVLDTSLAFSEEITGTSIKEIKTEVDAELEYYIGYGFDGKQKFKYRADSVNVHYL